MSENRPTGTYAPQARRDFVRFIGVAEVLGGIGVILPGLLRIWPGLTPLPVGLLSAFVAYGRWQLAPHRGSSFPV